MSPGPVIGELSPAAAEQLGLPAGLPVVGGAGDGQSAGLGANATRPGAAYLNLGTAVVAGSMSERYAWDRAFRTGVRHIPDDAAAARTTSCSRSIVRFIGARRRCTM